MSGKPVEFLPVDSAAAFRALFEQEVFGVAQADLVGRLVATNGRLADLLGYCADGVARPRPTMS